MLIRILLGLVGLGLVVFIHELGHFIAARMCGISVEAFSLGWGPPFISKKIAGTEYRLGVFPIGGYCKMSGEAAFREALARQDTRIPNEPGTFYGASPIKRCIVSVAGATANILFAIITLAFVWGIGFEVRTLDNRIVLASEIEPGTSYPADDAGLKSGDRIIAINGKATANYTEIQDAIAPNPGKELVLSVERNNEKLSLVAFPKLDPASGAGKLGIYFWTNPVIETVEKGGSAALAGIERGDVIISVNGTSLPHTAALTAELFKQPNVLNLSLNRNGEILNTQMIVVYGNDGSANLGLSFKTLRYRTPSLSPFAAISKGLSETVETLIQSVRGLGLLFRGIDLTKAVSGPVRITYMVGDIAAESFGESLGSGFSSIFNFLALLSIALGFMNLLPIPALDGGMIILFLVEAIRRKPLKTKTVYYFQLIGSITIFGLLLFSLFGDILFLTGQ